jgi:hypothetical protein
MNTPGNSCHYLKNTLLEEFSTYYKNHIQHENKEMGN